MFLWLMSSSFKKINRTFQTGAKGGFQSSWGKYSSGKRNSGHSWAPKTMTQLFLCHLVELQLCNPLVKVTSRCKKCQTNGQKHSCYKYSAVLLQRLLHAGFVHIAPSMYWCGFADLTFVLPAQICKLHECCTASDLNLILWMMASISPVNSGISYSERAWNSHCGMVFLHHFLNGA